MLQIVKARSSQGALSYSTKVLAQGLRAVTIPNIVDKLASIKDCIAACEQKGLKRLEVELRLMRLASNIFLDSSGFENVLVTADEELAITENICVEYPHSAGLLQQSCAMVQNSFHGHIKDLRRSLAERIFHPIYTKSTTRAWWKWPMWEHGNLRKCENGHPYSGASMRYCPECGPKVQIQKPEKVDWEAKLKGQDYVAAIQNVAFDWTKYRNVTPTQPAIVVGGAGWA